MKIAFDATPDDFVDLAFRIRKRSRALRRFLGQIVVFCAILCGVGSAVLHRDTLGSMLWAGGSGALLSAGLSLVLLYLFRPLEIQQIRRVYREQFGTDSPIGVSVEISESGVSYIQAGVQSTVCWECVQSIEERGDNIEIWKPGGPLIIRGRAFASDKQRNGFLEYSRKCFTDSRMNRGAIPVGGS